VREIKHHEDWKIFCKGIDESTNPSYIWDRMKKLNFRCNKTEREGEHTEELVISAKKTFEKLCSGVAFKKHLKISEPSRARNAME
jgi:hypothetical protein